MPKLRDPQNADEKVLLLEIERFRQLMFTAWLLELKFDADFKDVATEARVAPKTVERFVFGVSNPYATTVVRIAAAVGYRLTLVNRNAKRQPLELRADGQAGAKLLRVYGSVPKKGKKEK